MSLFLPKTPVSFYLWSKDVAVLVEEEMAEGGDVRDDEAVAGSGWLFGEGGGEGRRTYHL